MADARNLWQKFYSDYVSDVESNWQNLKNIPFPEDESLLPKYKMLCKIALEQNAKAIEFVAPPPANKPLSESYLAIYKAALDKNWEIATPMIPRPPKNEPLPKEFIELYRYAVEKSWYALQYLPKPIDSNDESYLEIYLDAVKKNASALQFIPEPIGNLTPSQIEMYVRAVKQDSMALKYIKRDDIKELVIDKITPEIVLLDDISSLQYFPHNEKYKNVFENTLKNVKHVIVSENYDSAEIYDSYKIYSNSEKRVGKTLRITTAELDKTLALLNSLGVEDLNLVLLGHLIPPQKTLAGLSVPAISNLLVKNPHIDRVTLLGCKTVLAKPLKEEIMMKEAYKSTSAPCGFVLAEIKSQENLDYASILKSVRLDRTFVLKQIDETQYKLIYLEKNNQGEIREKIYELNADHVKQLTKTLGKQSKGLDFPKSGISTINTNQKPLTTLQREEVFDIANNQMNKFSKSDPAFKQQKSIYPHLRNFNIDESEIDALLPSIFEELVKAVIANVPHSVGIKGFADVLHGDTKEYRFLVTEGKIFITENYLYSFFNRGEDNINRDKHRAESKSAVKGMEGKSQMFEGKSITFRSKSSRG